MFNPFFWRFLRLRVILHDSSTFKRSHYSTRYSGIYNMVVISHKNSYLQEIFAEQEYVARGLHWNIEAQQVWEENKGTRLRITKYTLTLTL